MRVAAAQIVTGKDLQKNLDLIDQWAGKAASAGAELVVFPEAAQRAFGYNLTSIAEPLDGPWAQQVRSIAAHHGLVIVAGMFTPAEPSEQGTARVANTLLVNGPTSEGTVDTSYQKLHLYDAFGFQESRTVQQGTAPVRFAATGLNFGLATCYDIRFPALFQHHARAGAQATLLSASWGAGPGKVEQWRVLAQARALDSTQYVIACGQGLPEAAGVAAPEGAPTGVGHSMIISPAGEILAEAGEAPELLVADLDPALVERTRGLIPVLTNARDIG
ncbi:carbon-nitrogen hydrolase family protein [Nesterenkonia massiliensis]|uniref:Carbon-nitrogen hydrolase family protein n=1 Tax=Nesterenkonia massiliensis TaxID=1232429 RepID=A0ABT2HNP0_9MICC|nr:carbon-nitrogen hydrolase family protein [Nesterenkonia massiliensis]MCT1606308.1 carbon-nitrogen hydrolase family protein [Nesterenkonia massiliensis]